MSPDNLIENARVIQVACKGLIAQKWLKSNTPKDSIAKYKRPAPYLSSDGNAQLADETIRNLIHPVMSLQLPSPESDDARQMSRKAYWGIFDYLEHRYPERNPRTGYPLGVASSVRNALLSNCLTWDNILTVREFIHGQEAGHPPDPETFNSLVHQANATLLAAESDVEVYLVLLLVNDLIKYKFTQDLLRLKRKIRSRLKYRLYNRGRKQWTDAFRQRLFATQGKACAGCGAKFNSHSSTALDHIESPIRGGADAPGNLQFLCHPCNGTKNVWGMWHLKQCLTEENRLIDSDAAEQAHQAALTFVV